MVFHLLFVLHNPHIDMHKELWTQVKDMVTPGRREAMCVAAW